MTMHRRHKRKRLIMNDLLRRLSKRMKKTIKRRMKGESRRQWIERNLHDSEVGIVLDVTQCFLSFVMVLAMINLNWNNPSTDFTTGYIVLDTINLLATLTNLGLRFYSASNRRSFLLHWLSIVEMVGAMPLLVEVTTETTNTGPMTYAFRLLMMLRAVRLIQFYRLLRLAKSAKFRQGLLICLTTLCVIICGGIFMQTIEYCDPVYRVTQVSGQSCQDMTFLDAIYFVCITIATVGFGDVAPKTSLGKAFDVALIFFAATLIPIQISGYSYILSRETAFDKKYKPDRSTQHVLVCGEVEDGALLFFLHNWLHKDEERRFRRKVVILAPNLPSNDLRRVLLHPDYEQRVIYLQGSAMVAADLQRAAAPSAKFCFVMVKKHSETLDQNDTAANLITCSVRKNNRHAPLHVQVSKFDNTRHFHISGATAVICLEQLKLALFGKCLWIRGLNPFLGNLIQKFNHTDESRGYWLSDYLSGCEQKLCEAYIPPFLYNMVSYRALALLLYREFGVPLVGLRTLEEMTIVYPVDEELSDENFLSVFFISRESDVVSKIEKLTPAIFARHPDIAPAALGVGNRSMRTVGNIRGATKIPFTRRVSVGFGFDGQNPMQDKGMTIGNVKHSSGRSSRTSIFSGRTLEKITPVNGEEDGHGNAIYKSEEFAAPNVSIDAANDVDITRVATQKKLPKITLDPVETPQHQDVESMIPAIALTPAKLVQMTSTSRKCSSDVVIKSLPSQIQLSPRSARTEGSSTGIRRTDASPGKFNRGHSLRDSLFMRPSKDLLNTSTSPSDLAPLQTSSSNIEDMATKQLEEPMKEQDIGSSSVATSLPTEPQVQLKKTSALRKIFRSEEDNYIPSRRETGVLQRPSVGTSGHLRTRIRNLSLCFRRNPPPMTLCEHFVICGTPSNYKDFLTNLCDVKEQISGVVFITQRTLTEKDLMAQQVNENLYFVHGSPLSMHVFHTARIFHARSILIMSYCGMESTSTLDGENNSENTDENMADVDAITTHRFISEALQNEISRQEPNGTYRSRPMPFIVAEMIRPSNVKFLIDRSGSLYDAKSPANESRQRDLLKDVKIIDNSFFSPLYASGQIYFSNFVDALMGSCSNQQLMIEMVTQLVISGDMNIKMPNRVQRSRHRLTQIPAPERYHFRPYALLVEGLLHNEGTMTLGIYRSVSTRISPQFVITNPPGDELVAPQDLLFVIK